MDAAESDAVSGFDPVAAVSSRGGGVSSIIMCSLSGYGALRLGEELPEAGEVGGVGVGAGEPETKV